MLAAIALFVGIVAAPPCLLYALRHTQIISPRTSDILISLFIVIVAAGFLVLCAAVFVQAGLVVNPGKTAPHTLLPRDAPIRTLFALGMIVFLGGGAFWIGISSLRSALTNEKVLNSSSCIGPVGESARFCEHSGTSTQVFRSHPSVLLVTMALVIIPLLAFLVARTGAFGAYGMSVERIGACALLTGVALYHLDLWKRKAPLRHLYAGSVLDPKERPRAYALCMGFLSMVFVLLAVFGWVREISRVVSGG